MYNNNWGIKAEINLYFIKVIEHVFYKGQYFDIPL